MMMMMMTMMIRWLARRLLLPLLSHLAYRVGVGVSAHVAPTRPPRGPCVCYVPCVLRVCVCSVV